jgi:hypothetical protein
MHNLTCLEFQVAKFPPIAIVCDNEAHERATQNSCGPRGFASDQRTGGDADRHIQEVSTLSVWH